MWQILLVVLLAAVLFGGRGKIAAVMGDFAKGITSFRKGLKDDEDETASDAEDTSAIRDESRDDEKTGS
jgi:sec-independent protein translocase protein TatA